MAARMFKMGFKIVADGKGGVKTLKSVKREMGNLEKTQTSLNRNMAHSTSLLQGYGGALAGLSFVAVGKSILEAGWAMDSFNTLLEDNQIEFLTKLTDEFGVSLQGSARSFSLLNAAAADSELAGEGVEEVFESMVIASRAFNLSAEDMRGLLRAVEQMMNKGTVQAEELRGQLSERLPGAFTLTAKAMGITTQELSKMLEQGQVVATEMLPKLARALKEKYGDKAIQMSKLGAAGIERVRNEFFLLRAELADGGISEAFVDATSALGGALKGMNENIEVTKDVMTGLSIVMSGKLASAFLMRKNGIGQSIAASLALVRADKATYAAANAVAAANVKKAMTAKASAAAELLQVRAMNASMLAAGQTAAATNVLSAARIKASTASANLIKMEAALMGVTRATGLAATAGAGLLAMLGGLPGLAIMGTVGFGYLIAKSQEFSKSTQDLTANLVKYGAEVNEEGKATANSITAKKNLTNHLEKLKEAYAKLTSNQKGFGEWLDKTTGIASSTHKLGEEIFFLQNALVKISPGIDDLTMEMTDLENQIVYSLGDLEKGRKAAAAALVVQFNATKEAISWLKEENDTLQMNAEEKFKATMLQKALKEEVDASKESLIKYIDILWKKNEAEKTATAVMKAAMKEAIAMAKAIDKANKASKEYSAELADEVKHLQNVVKYGEDAADNMASMEEVIKNSTVATLAANVANEQQRVALEKTIAANKKVEKSTEDLTEWIDEEKEAYEELYDAILQQQITDKELDALEARALGHEDAAAAIDLEIAALQRYNAQQGDSVEFTYDQILAQEQYKASLIAQAEAHKKLASDEAAILEDREKKWDNMVENVQREWGNLFYGYMEKALMDGEFSFAEFRDNIYKMFIRLLADMAAKWAVTKIFGAFGGGGFLDGLLGSGGGLASTTSAGITKLTTAYTTYIAGAKAAAAGTEVVVTGMKALAPAAEAAEFSSLQAGNAAQGASAGYAALGAAAGVAIVGMIAHSSHAKRAAEVTAEVSAKMKEAEITISNSSVTFGKWGEEGVGMLNTALSQSGTLNHAMRTLGANVEYVRGGALLVKAGFDEANIAATAFTDETSTELGQMVDDLREVEVSHASYALRVGEAQREVGKSWGESLEIINSTNFDNVIAAFDSIGVTAAGVFEDISSDGIISADEIKAHFGASADSIITEMSGASSITITELFNILGVSESVTNGLSSDFATASDAAAREWGAGTEEIQRAINSLEGTSVTSTHNIEVTRSYNGDGGGGKALGTGGKFETVPSGYPNDSYPVFMESGEDYMVRTPADRAAAKSGQSGSISVGGGGDNQVVVRLDTLIAQNAKIQARLSGVENAVYLTGTDTVNVLDDQLRDAQANR